MRFLLALAALPLLTTFAPYALYKEPVLPPQPKARLVPVPLDEGDPARRLGGLLFLGGWAIESNDPRFGGISAMHVEGDQVLALSDAVHLTHHDLPATRPAPGDARPPPHGPG